MTDSGSTPITNHQSLITAATQHGILPLVYLALKADTPVARVSYAISKHRIRVFCAISKRRMKTKVGYQAMKTHAKEIKT